MFFLPATEKSLENLERETLFSYVPPVFLKILLSMVRKGSVENLEREALASLRLRVRRGSFCGEPARVVCFRWSVVSTDVRGGSARRDCRCGAEWMPERLRGGTWRGVGPCERGRSEGLAFCKGGPYGS